MKNLYLIIGPSGSGKTTLAKVLTAGLPGISVDSYTTRKPRYEGEQGHIFVTEEEFRQLGEMVAYTYYQGQHYGVTAEMLDKSDLYIVDPKGAMDVLKNYKRKSGAVIVMWLFAEGNVLEQRMWDRGDSVLDIAERRRTDKRLFSREAMHKLYNETAGPKMFFSIDANRRIEDILRTMFLYIRICEKQFGVE